MFDTNTQSNTGDLCVGIIGYRFSFALWDSRYTSDRFLLILSALWEMHNRPRHIRKDYPINIIHCKNVAPPAATINIRALNSTDLKLHKPTSRIYLLMIRISGHTAH